ncbi:hypothetical protein ACFWWC_13870 [Streptomyces sp. NPDC058642]|uniref:hypothetical protein n=1 Tax=Streptomyces sp. NPDC058642 TaxID=3346572 RepID=UPI0036505FA4
MCRRRPRHRGPGAQRIEAHREAAAEHDGDAQTLVVQAQRGATAADLPPDELRHGRQLLAVGRRLEHGEEPFEERAVERRGEGGGRGAPADLGARGHAVRGQSEVRGYVGAVPDVGRVRRPQGLPEQAAVPGPDHGGEGR